MERVLRNFAFSVLCGFPGVLVYKLPRLDLGVVVALAVMMAF